MKQNPILKPPSKQDRRSKISSVGVPRDGNQTDLQVRKGNNDLLTTPMKPEPASRQTSKKWDKKKHFVFLAHTIEKYNYSVN